MATKEVPDYMKPYLLNKMQKTHSDSLKCSKCKKQIQPETHLLQGHWYYRDVTTDESAHITCPRKAAQQPAQ